MKTLKLIVKNLGRNLIRTGLTTAGIMVLVFVVTLVWSILAFLDKQTREKASNFKGIATERWRLPSQMPFAYARGLSDGASREPGDVRPQDAMTWQFFGGSLSQDKSSDEERIFVIGLEPRKMATMLNELDSLKGDAAAALQDVIHRMEDKREAIVMGQNLMAKFRKRIGDRLTVYSFNYPDINLEFEIVGTLPPGRYDDNSFFNRDYLNAALEAYPLTHNNQPHPMLGKTLNLVWLRVPDQATFSQLGEQITGSPEFKAPSVKFEAESTGVSGFLDAYRDLIWGMRWLLAPAILVTLALVISNAISISARERRTEMAVLKVLGFGPNRILFLILGEAVLLGIVSGLVSSLATYLIVNRVMGGIKFPIAFFDAFYIPHSALWWGVAIGGLAALAGSIVPAWNTRSVKVAEVFSKVA